MLKQAVNMIHRRRGVQFYWLGQYSLVQLLYGAMTDSTWNIVVIKSSLNWSIILSGVYRPYSGLFG